MKSLLKIIRRYSLSAGIIILIILFCNVGVLCYWGYQTSKEKIQTTPIRTEMEIIAENFTKIQGEYQLQKEGKQVLNESGFVWAMALDVSGKVIWEWNLPEELPRSYTIQDVASFTRWYLEDYPVRVWRYHDLLLVFGNAVQSEIKYNAVFSPKLFTNIPLYLKSMIIANLAVIGVFILCFGYRFYEALRPVAEGIEQLSRQESLHIKETGMARELAEKLNMTSRLLEEQKQKLEKRDKARTEWISGVSHDIRTPLSLILGYSDCLADSEELGEKEKNLADAIRRQSMIISQLIQDLNLTSKLSYHSQPLNKIKCFPASMLRECAADFYNEELSQNFEIHISIEERAEQISIQGDEALLKRAFRNLIGNSIKHNPEGCYVEVYLSEKAEGMECLIKDTGPGIPQKVAENMEKENSEVHIMGLRLARQIIRAHGGELYFVQRTIGTYDIKLYIPIK